MSPEPTPDPDPEPSTHTVTLSLTKGSGVGNITTMWLQSGTNWGQDKVDGTSTTGTESTGTVSDGQYYSLLASSQGIASYYAYCTVNGTGVTPTQVTTGTIYGWRVPVTVNGADVTVAWSIEKSD